MTWDDAKFVQDRDGVGHTLARKLLANVEADSFNTVIRKLPNGDEVMLRTKGGMPEITVTKPRVLEGCIKGPLTEIAFKYVNPTALTGYRRWYGEPDAVSGLPAKQIQYEWSSDGLFQIETRKLQKICFTDGNGATVDFLFAKKPADASETPAATSAALADSTARFRFTEGSYSDRSWHRSVLADIGWAFAGPTISGDPSPEPASAVKFFLHRLQATVFTVTDSLGKIRTATVRWLFANDTDYPEQSLGANTTACTNQNAREASFTGRHFFPVVTDGNMDEVTMCLGLAAPPANANAPSFKIILKKPGSLTAAIDPEGALGNTRPADPKQAIDLAEFSSFGNPYHGLVWITSYTSRKVYTDSTRTTTVKVLGTSTDLAYEYPGIHHYGSVMNPEGGHRYYNLTQVDPLGPGNVVQTDNPLDGAMYKDALLIDGIWYMGHADANNWQRIDQYEALYRDGEKNLWVIRLSVAKISPIICRITPTLQRRFGVLGRPYTNDIARVLPTVDVPIDLLSNLKYRLVHSEDASQVMIVIDKNTRTEGKNNLTSYNDFVLYGICVSFSGNGATVDDVDSGISIGDGISVSAELMYGIERSLVTTTVITKYSDPNGYLWSGHTVSGTQSITCSPSGSFTLNTAWANDYAATERIRDATTTLKVGRLDIIWLNGEWVEITGTIKFDVKPQTTSVSWPSGSRTYTGALECRTSNGTDYYGALSDPLHGCNYSSTAGSVTITTEFEHTVAIAYNGVEKKSLSFSKRTIETRAIGVTESGTGAAALGDTHPPGSNPFTDAMAYGNVLSTSYSHAGFADCAPIDTTSATVRELDVHCFYHTPRSKEYTGSYSSMHEVPRAWVIGVEDKYYDPAIMATPSLPATAVFRDTVQDIPVADFYEWTMSSTTTFSSNIGWAYNYRSKEFITVPFDVVAFFI